MRHIPVLLATVLAVVIATPLDAKTFRERIFLSDENLRNSALEQLFLNLMEELRVIMTIGTDTIPVLDPLVVDEIYVDENTIDIIPGYISANDMKVDGLSTFEINQVNIALASILQPRLQIFVDGSIPVVDVEVGGYDLDLTIYGGSVFGKGDAKLKLTEPRIRVSLLLAVNLNNGIFINIMECKISVSLGSFDPQITGMFNDPVINDFVNAFLKKFVEEGLVVLEDDITEFISNFVLEFGNDILAELDLSGILGI